MAKDVIGKIIAALCDLSHNQNELEEILNEYDISLKDEDGNYRSTFDILTDIANASKE